MDHLPLPRDPMGPQIRVPYVATEDFDGGSFADFPTRKGWNVVFAMMNCEFEYEGSKPSVAQIASFLQSWFYFGLLHHTVGPSYRDTSFSTTDEAGHKWLSTKDLPRLLADWLKDLTTVDDLNDLGPLKRKLKDTEQHISGVRTRVSHIAQSRPDALGPEMLLAISILAETLTQVLLDVQTIADVSAVMRDNLITGNKWRLCSAIGTFDSGRILLDFMANNGWCPYDLARIAATVDQIGTLYYLANLNPPKAYACHDRCTKYICSAATIDPKSYKLPHARNGCDCPLVYADSEKLSDTLLAGQLPLLYITEEDQDGQALMDIRPYRPDDKFIALSHVWAEGLGNPFDNAIHACELGRLASLSKNLNAGESPLPLWIDTLCVPVGPKSLQKLALARMREPYERASHVLVLDDYFLNTSADTIDIIEIFGRAICSTWTQRLWTLQEGRLARNVYFQFKDQAISLRERYQATNFQRIPSQAHRCVLLDLIFSYEASHFANKLPEYNGDLLSTRRNLKTRSVSVASDEALCVACLMKMELEDIVDAPEMKRMEVLWWKIGQVPSGMAFSRAADKLSTPGLRWAPASFLGFTPNTGQGEDSWYGSDRRKEKTAAMITKRGLAVRLPGIILHPKFREFVKHLPVAYDEEDRLFLSDHIYIHDERGQWYVLIKGEPWTDKPREDDNLNRRQGILLDESPAQLSSLDQTIEITGLSKFSTGHPIWGVLVDIESQDSTKSICVHGRQHVIIASCRYGFSRILQMSKELALKIRAGLDCATGQLDISFWNNKATEAFQENEELRSLYEEHARFTHKAFRPENLARYAELLASVGDRVSFETTDDDQLWYID